MEGTYRVIFRDENLETKIFPCLNRDGNNFPSLNRDGNDFPSLNRDGNCFPSLFRDGNVFPCLNRDGKISVSILQFSCSAWLEFSKSIFFVNNESKENINNTFDSYIYITFSKSMNRKGPQFPFSNYLFYVRLLVGSRR